MKARLGLALACAWLGAAMPVTDELQTHRNLGKAFYERGEYAQAVEELVAVLDTREATAQDYFNGGLALLQNGSEDDALASFLTAKRLDPEMIAADFGLGVLYKRQLRHPKAREAFQRVLERDGGDPCTWLNLGMVFHSMGEPQEASRAFRKVIDLGFARGQNFYASALFREATLVARRGEKDEARRLFAEFESTRKKMPNVSLTASALENGRYARIRIPEGTEPPPVIGKRVVFSRPAELPYGSEACAAPPGLALGDWDGDGLLDIFLANPCGANRLLANRREGRFEDVTENVGLGSSRNGRAAVFIDHDNSGVPSLLVIGSGLHLHRHRNGRYLPAEKLPVETGDVRQVVPFDYDSDGQLDLFWCGDGVGLLRNRGGGRFDDVSAEALKGQERVAATGAGFADFDEDGYPDVLVVEEGGSGLLLENRVGRNFLGQPVPLRLGNAGEARIEVEDVDHDGWLDAVVSTDEGYVLARNRRGNLRASARIDGTLLATLDADGDGWKEMLRRDPEGKLSLVRFSGESVSLDMSPPPAGSTMIAADLEGRGLVDAVSATAERLYVHRNATAPRVPAVCLRLEGVKSNRGAVGAVVETRAGSFYQKELYRGIPLTLFTQGRESMDVIRVTWSNGVVQNEISVSAASSLELVEANRQTSSCPFLYVWDGGRFRFLTDFVGRAPLGEITPAGGLVAPHPEDYVRVPPELLTEKDGSYVFQLTEELKETAYIDAVFLQVIDHPEGGTLYTNERFSAPPFDPFRLYRVETEEIPSRAEDGLGRDVRSEISRADGEPVGGLVPTGIPGISREHYLVLEPSGGCDRPLWLFLTGWVDWPSSSSMRALAGSNESPRLPELQVKDGAGAWKTVIPDLGLPSGIGRTLVADLRGKFISGDCSLRILTDVSVYWDRAFFSASVDAESWILRTLEPGGAALHYRGFSTPVGRGIGGEPPLFDYEKLLPEPPWNAVSGRYTRFGDVAFLLRKVDDRMVVMAPGDELTVSFGAGALPPVAPGFRRDFILHATGWAKDQDPNTLFSRTVEPLPYGDLRDYQRARERRGSDTYRTRAVPTLVPPLAPPRRLDRR